MKGDPSFPAFTPAFPRATQTSMSTLIAPTSDSCRCLDCTMCLAVTGLGERSFIGSTSMDR